MAHRLFFGNPPGKPRGIRLQGTGSSADYLRRSANIVDHNSTYTISLWFQIVVDKNDYGHIWAANSDSVTDASGDYVNADYLSTGADGTTLNLNCYVAGAGSSTTGLNAVVGTWYHATIVRESTTALKFYINGVQQGSTVTRDVSARAATVAEFLGRLHQDYGQNMRVAAVKRWNVALTAAEVLQEGPSYAPVKTTGLIGFAPMSAGNLTDALVDLEAGDSWINAGSATVVESGAPVNYAIPPEPSNVSSKLQVDGVGGDQTFNSTAIGFTITAGNDYILQTAHYVSGGADFNGVTIGGTVATLAGKISQVESGLECWYVRNCAASNTDVVIDVGAGSDYYITAVLTELPAGTLTASPINASGSNTTSGTQDISASTVAATTSNGVLTFTSVGTNSGGTIGWTGPTQGSYTQLVFEDNSSAHQSLKADYKRGEVELGAKTVTYGSNAAGRDYHALIIAYKYNDLGPLAADPALTGVSTTGALGSLGSDRTLALGGVSATCSVGTVGYSAGSMAAPLGTFDVTAVSVGWFDEIIGLRGIFNGGFLEAGAGSPDITLPLTTVSSTAAVGSLTTSRSLAFTGVGGTGSVGTTAPNTAFATSGVSSAAAVGSLVYSAALPVTGNSATGNVGTLVYSLTLPVTGNSATGAVGTVNVSLTLPVTGNSATGAVGVVTYNLTIPVTGNSATGSVGTVSLGADDLNLALTGVAGTTGLGSVIPSFTSPVTGNSFTGFVGTMLPTRSLPVTGNSGAGALGTIAPQDSLGFTGVGGAAAVGTLGPGRSLDLSGNLANTQVGTVGLNITLALSGNSSAAAVGSVGINLNSDITLALSGVVGTSGVNTFGVQVTKGVTGNQIALQQGVILPDVSKPVTGNSASGSVGTVVQSRQAPVTGNSLNSAVGDFSLGVTKGVTGNSGASAVASVGLERQFPLTGFAATGSVGSLVYSTNLALTKVTATGQLGNYILGIPADVRTILYKTGKFQISLVADGEFQTSYNSTKKFGIDKSHTGEF